MKLCIKSIGLLLYFVIAQCISTVVLFFWKISINDQWLDNVMSILGENEEFIVDYFMEISDLIFVALIVADIIVILSFLLRGICNKERIFYKVERKEIAMIFCSAICLNTIVVDNLPSFSTFHYDKMMSMITNGRFVFVFLASGILIQWLKNLFSAMEFFCIAHINVIQ